VGKIRTSCAKRTNTGGTTSKPLGIIPAIGRWAYQAKKEEEEQINVVLLVNEN
jgi:hypothetical protein